MADKADDLRYAVYGEQRKHYVTAGLESERSYDKLLVTLSTGAIGFSMLFCEKMGRPASGALLAAWISFGVSLVAALVSMQTSATAWRKAAEDLDEDYQNQQAWGSTQTGHWGEITFGLNVGSLTTFCFGLSMLIVFVRSGIQ